jgi:hypothetical protein
MADCTQESNQALKTANSSTDPGEESMKVDLLIEAGVRELHSRAGRSSANPESNTCKEESPRLPLDSRCWLYCK